jgi:hypothetical protein
MIFPHIMIEWKYNILVMMIQVIWHGVIYIGFPQDDGSCHTQWFFVAKLLVLYSNFFLKKNLRKCQKFSVKLYGFSTN